MMMTTPAGAFLNGASLTIDGGWSMVSPPPPLSLSS